MKIDKICWNITNLCNENCIYCFREKRINGLDLQDNLRILDCLYEYGIKNITFSGGEAILHPHLKEILKYCNSKKLNITLDTNCSAGSQRFIKENIKHIDWITFPLDTLDQKIQSELGRECNHVKNVRRMINYISKLETKPFIKINTVLTSKNYHNAIDIVNLIKECTNIKRWKVLRFTALRGDSLSNAKLLSITDKEFDSFIKDIKKLEIDRYCRLNIEGEEAIRTSYAVISPDGSIFNYYDETYECIGNLLNESLDNLLGRMNIDFIRYNRRNNDKYMLTIEN